MKLYHGTDGAKLNWILKTGIKPRGAKGRSNWTHSIESNPKCVYLTDSYAPHFAFNAAKGKDPMCAVLEIDTDRLDPDNLFPDEDFLEQISRNSSDPVPGSMVERTRHYRKRQFEFNYPAIAKDGSVTTWWESSLHYLGTCSHKGVIPPSAITAAVSWPHKPNASLSFIFDLTVSILNQRICGDRYRALTRKLFAGEFSTDKEFQNKSITTWIDDPLLPIIKGWNRIELGKPDDQVQARPEQAHLNC